MNAAPAFMSLKYECVLWGNFHLFVTSLCLLKDCMAILFGTAAAHTHTHTQCTVCPVLPVDEMLCWSWREMDDVKSSLFHSAWCYDMKWFKEMVCAGVYLNDLRQADCSCWCVMYSISGIPAHASCLYKPLSQSSSVLRLPCVFHLPVCTVYYISALGCLCVWSIWSGPAFL